MLQSAVRFWLRRWTLGVLVVSLLGLPIGLTLAAFGAVYALLLVPLPYPNVDSLVAVVLNSNTVASWPGPTVRRWQEETTVFDALSCYTDPFVAEIGASESRPVMAAAITASTFKVLGVWPIKGRPLLPEDEGVRTASIVVVSESLWRTTLGAPVDIVGSTVVVDGTAREVVGVVPDSFAAIDHRVSIWMPFDPRSSIFQGPDGRFVAMVPRCHVLARLNDGVPREAARTEAQRLQSDKAAAVGLLDYVDWKTAHVRPAVMLLQAVTILVLCCAILNASALLSAIGYSRSAEITIRRVLGASSIRLTWQLLLEGVIIAIVVLVVALASAGVAIRLSPRPEEFLTIGLSPLVWVVAILTVFLSVVFGVCLPMFVATRYSKRASAVVRAGGPSSSVARSFLIIQGVAAMVLLVGSLSTTRSLLVAAAVQPAYVSPNIGATEVNLARARLGVGVTMAMERLRENVASLPGVSSVALTSALPGQARSHPVAFGSQGAFRHVFVTEDFFKIMRLSVVAGRTLLDEIDASAVVVSRVLATQRFGLVDPIGKSFPFQGQQWSIVGVVDDLRDPVGSLEPTGAAYFPFRRMGDNRNAAPTATLVVETTAALDTRFADIERTVREVVPSARIDAASSFSRWFDKEVSPLRVSTGLIRWISLLSIGTAASGVFAVLTFAVARRRHELGVRMALGASRRVMFRLIMREATIVVAFVVPAAIGLAVVSHGALRASVERVQPLSADLILLASGLTAVVVWAAALRPAWEASRSNPSTILRAS